MERGEKWIYDKCTLHKATTGDVLGEPICTTTRRKGAGSVSILEVVIQFKW